MQEWQWFQPFYLPNYGQCRNMQISSAELAEVRFKSITPALSREGRGCYRTFATAIRRQYLDWRIADAQKISPFHCEMTARIS